MNALLNIALTLGQLAIILVAVFYILIIGWLITALCFFACTSAWESVRTRYLVRRLRVQVSAWRAPSAVPDL